MIRQLCKIYGHMDFNDTEEEIIRHPAFNRLADIKQLGYTYKGAYKGGAHTRLSHALGTSYLSKQIWKETIKKGYDAITKANGNTQIFPDKKELDELKEFETLVGTASLLHDIRHTPFAHAIQYHLALAEMLTSEAWIEAKVEEFNTCKKFDQALREQTKDVLMTSRHNRLKHAKLIYSLIRGDLGASCIDYVVRDHFEVGFKKPNLYASEELEFILVKHNGRIALALDLIESTNPLTSVHQLLFTRYKLSERVYFHFSCTAAEAMVGKCLRRLLEIEKDSKERNLLRTFLANNQTDARFFHSLENHDDNLISYLGRRLQDRQLFKAVFKLQLPPDHEMRTRLCEDYRGEDDYLTCIKLEKAIAEKCSVNERDIIVYCHNTKMFSFDVNDSLVLTPFYDIIELNKLPREEYIEIDSINLIKRFHQKLWAFYVFCGDRTPETLQKVNALCSQIFKSPKDLRNFLMQSEKPTALKEESPKGLKVFISYNHADGVISSQIENSLRQKKLDVFRYETNLKPGHRWTGVINSNLKSCHAIIVIWSKDADGSDWVDKEIAYGMNEKKKIIIVKIDDVPVKPLMTNIQAIIHSDFSKTMRDILRGLGIEEGNSQ